MAKDERARQRALLRKKRRRDDKRAQIAEADGWGGRFGALGLRSSFNPFGLGSTLEALASRMPFPGLRENSDYRARKALIRSAREFPIHECVARSDMDSQGIGPLLITRMQPDGNLVFATFLVDLYCLGVKDAFCNSGISIRDYESRLKPSTVSGARPRIIPPDLLHQLVYGAIDYAASIGFEPHRDFELASCLLDPRETVPRNPGLRFGKEGKPFFISGPNDNVPRVLRILERNVGAGNFDFLIGDSIDG